MRREARPDVPTVPSLELLEPRLLLAGTSGSVDLVITEATAPASARLGEGFEVTWTVKNQGPDGALGPWTDAVYFSDDPVLNLPQGEEDAGDYQLVSTISEGLAADQTYTVTFWVGLPYYGSGGTCYLLFVADVDDNVPEANESNNTLAVPINIIPPDVDLTVTVAAAPASLRLSDSFDVSWTVTNQGSEDVWEYWEDMVFYSADSVLDPADVRIGRRYGGGGGEGGLPGGGTYNSNVTVSLPGGLPAGPAHLLIVTDGARRIPETDETNNTFDLPITVTLPDVDLQVTGATAPASGLLGGAVSVSWTVKNFGAEEAVADWYDSIYVSSDAMFDPGDVLAGYAWIEGQTPLAGGASYTIDNMSVSIPNGAPTGAVYLLFVADRGTYAEVQNRQGETDETNNVVARPITLTPPDVDLVITSTTAPATVLAGQYLTVSWTGKNQGGAATQRSYWYDHVYYSDDAVLDKRDVLLAYGSVQRALPPGDTYAVSGIPIQIPATISTGTHYLLFVADGYNYQAETDEANNVLAVPVAVEQPAADLAITDVTVPASVLVGQPVSLSWKGINQGTTSTTAQLWYDAVYYSEDDVLDESDPGIGSAFIWGPVAAGAAYDSGSTTAYIPATATPGTRYLFLRADAYGYQLETDETNNVYRVEINVASADLAVKAATAPAAAILGDTISVSWTVANQGAGAATNWSDGVYLSKTASFPFDDSATAISLLSERLAGPVAPGGEYTLTRDVTLPSSLSGGGAYYLLFVADKANELKEPDETNNVLALPIDISGADLVVTAASVTPASSSLGATVHISYTVENQGTAPAKGADWGGSYGWGWWDSVYLSAYPDLNHPNASVDVGWNTLSTPLAAGATYTVERDVALPNSLPPGQLYLLFAIDQTQWYGSLQGEIDETNNLRAVPITVGGPDLVVSAASAPASVALSSVVEVSWTVANVGAEPARGTWIHALYFSTDPVLSVNDYFVNSASNPAALPAGGNYIDTRNVFIPTVPLGDGYLLFVTNDGFWQGETDTTNNVRALPIKIVAPDLVVTEATAPASAIAGQKINVSWTVANQGEAWAYSAWYDGVWISTDPFVDNWDALAGYVDQAAHRLLAAGATYTTSRTVTVPNVGVGDFYILFVADRRYDGYSLQGESNEMNNTLALPIHIQAPDLQVTAATAPETAVVNSTVVVSYTVTNTGTVMAPATWVDAVYLSEDAVRGNDWSLGWWSNAGWTPLAAGASYTMTRWITLPTWAIGQKYLLFVADDGTGAGTQGETNEANNLRAAPILVVSPDLTVSAASASVSSASPGDTVSVSWTVLNQGTTPAPADWYDYVYLSKDATLDGGDAEARKESIWAQTPLAAGAAYTVNRDITIPNFEPGDWYLLFAADRNNQQGETDENNNVRAVPITVTVPDLKVTAASAPSAATLSQTISVSWTVANIGNVAAKTRWYDAVYLSTDATWDAYDESLDYKDAGANVPLAPGASYTADLTFQVPEFQTGPCWLIFVTDHNEWQAESDETNNTFSLPITLSAPDLAVTAATAPASAILSQTVDVSWTVANQGPVDTAANWVDEVYLSRSTTFDGTTRWLATVPGKPLAAGADYLATASVTIPDVGTGAFYFLFVADADGDQAETNENNNVRAAPITLGAPDFVVTGAGGPALATFGQTVDVSWTVANQGAVPTAVPAWYDSLYLSRDSTFSGNDIWLASVDQSGQAPLAPGASYTAGRTLAIPDVGTGDFYWLFVADRYGISNVQGFNNLQAETDETNNVFAVPLRIETPDLEMTATAAPATGVVSGAVEVSWTVTNIGSVLALADWTDAVYLSSDPNLDLGDWELVAWSAAARTPLAAGDHYDVTQTVLVPSLGVGPKYLIFVTDRDSDQGEAGEANNLRVVPIQIAAPDLTVTAASAAASASLGASVSVSWTVLNQGAVEAPAAWSDAVFLSADPVWDGSDVLVATVDASAHAMLAAGSSYTLTRTVAIPEFALGDQYLLFYADRGNKQGETNENNNAFAVPVHLTAADLQIANLTVTPAALKSGGSLTVRWEDVNTGTGPTPGRFYDRIVVRNTTTGQTLHAAMVAYEPGPGERIDPDQSLAREYVYRLPDGPPGVGQLDVTVTTDARQDAGMKGDVIEYNASGTGETNNAASAGATSVLAPYPDLAVTDILVPPEAVSGQLVPITWTVANLGDGPAVGPWGDTVFLSADTTAGGDQWLGAFGFDGTLAPGQSLTRSQVVFVPITSAGDWHVVVETNSGHAFYEHATANNTLVAGGLLTVRMAPLPNLQVQAITPPTLPFAGQQTVIEWTVTNTGTGSTNAAAWADGVWLSTDATWGGGDLFLGEAANGSYLGVGESYTSSLTVTLPVTLEGQVYFIVRTDSWNDAYELDELDNMAAAGPVEVQPSAPADLQVTSVTAPAVAFSGQPLTVTWQVSNEGIGPTPSSSWRDDVYLSADAAVDGSDVWLGMVRHSVALDAGAHYGASKTFTLPVNMSGDFYVIVVTDLTDDVYERGGETNNVRATTSTTKVHLVAPDLHVTSVTSPPTAMAGQDLTIAYQTGNSGTAGTPISSWSDDVYLSLDDQWQSSDLRLGTKAHNGFLDAGRTATESFTLRLPDGLSGTFYVFVVGDAGGSVFELDEANNVSPAGGPVVVESKPPDLVVSAAAPDMAEAGGAIRVNWTVSNNGTGAPSTGSWNDMVVLSTDPVLDPGDRQLLNIWNNRLLEPGQSYSRSEVVGIPWDVVGNYTLFVVTDTYNFVYESDKGNNAAAGSPLRIERRLSDLAVTQVTADPAALSGGKLHVAWQVQNVGVGRGNASVWYDAVFLSSGILDIPLGVVSCDGGLNPGSSYGASGTFDLPRDLTGTFYVKVYADAYSHVIENNKADNVRLSDAPTVITLAPTPDLVVPSVDAPTEAISGQGFGLTWTVRNDGAAPTGRGWSDAVYLSRDLIFDPGVDTYVGFRSRDEGLAVGESYTATRSFDVPPGLSGLFYALVLTDAGNRVLERGGEGNNVGLDPYAMLVTLAPPADLLVGTITLPANAVPGQPIAITYTVANQGQNAARGDWYDSLYVSTDSQWDIGDALVGRAHHWGDVAAGTSYTETLQAPVPGVLPGDYAVIVRTDIRNHVAETSEANNIGASLDRVAIDAEELLVDVPAQGVIAAGQSVYYRIDVPRERTLELTFDSDSSFAGNELYIRFGQMPTRGVFDLSYSWPYEPDQRIVVPATREGAYYVLAYAAYAPTASMYTLTGHLLAFGLTALAPLAVGNAGPATFEVTGALLGPTMSYELVDPTGVAVPASAVYFVDATRVYATFDLTGLPVGAYLARVTRAGGAVAELAAAVAVTVGVGPKLQAGLAMPPFVRPGPFTLTLEYQNTGDADLVAPLLDVTGPAGAMFGLRFGQATAQGEIRLLGYSPTGPAGVLRPGQRERIQIYCSQLPVGYQAFGLTTLIVDPNNPTPQSVAWDSLGQASQPPFADPQEWQALWTVFSAQAGASWQESLAQLARELTAKPYLSDGTPNILVDDLFDKAFIDALSRGGGLTDHELPWVLTHLVSAQGGGVSSIELVFSKSIDPASFTPDDLTLTGPAGLSITPLTVTEACDRLFRVTFAAQSVPGTYHLRLAPDVADTVGQRLDQDRDGKPGEAADDTYDASFRVAAGGAMAGQLYIAAQTPAGVRDQREGVDHVTVNFSQPIYFQTFTPADVHLAGPGGAIQPTAVTQMSATAYRIDFPRQDALGTYSISVGPDITALTGKKMDQNGDGVDGFAGNDRYVATFQIADIHGPRVVAYTPDGWMDQAVNTIEVTFNEPIKAETFTLAQVSVTGPDGPIVPTDVTHNSDTVFQVTIPWQSASPDYSFTIGPDIRDLAGNAMDQNLDDVNGAAGDAFTGTFHILDGVQLNPLPGETQGVGPAMRLMAPPPAWAAPVAIYGRVVYSAATELATHFPNGAHQAVQLWEEVGNRDLTLGVPDSGDPADKLISTTNAITKSDLLDDTGRFIFEKDTGGMRIYNVDFALNDPVDPTLPAMAKYYVVVLAKNAYGFVVEEASVTQTQPADLANKPWLTPLHPEGYPLGATAEWQWGKLYADTTSSPAIQMQPPSSATTPFQTYAMPDIQVYNDEFGLPEWVRYGALWIQKEIGVPPRRTIAISVPWALGQGASPDNAAHWSWDYISVGANAIATPGIIMHEYGHALQFAANNYLSFPYDKNSSYGVVQEGSAQTTTLAEAWASFVAAKVLYSAGTVKKGAANTLVRLDYNRSGQFLDANNFWMGYDAYGFAGNGAAGDMAIDASQLAGLFKANGINKDANTGDLVMGAVESILWDLAAGGGGVGNAGVWAAMKTATAAGSTTQAFYEALTAAYPGAKRQIDAIFIDHGVPVADDKYYSSSGVYDLGTLSKPIALDGLIMSKKDEGGTDAFEFDIPATTDAKGDKTYTLTVRVEFAERYGDLDLRLSSMDWQPGVYMEWADIERTGSDAEIVIGGLHTKQKYHFDLDVFGHGAILEDKSENGGDFHPDYRLVISIKFPGPKGQNPGGGGGTNVVVPIDPNDILGPPGFGPEHWIPAAQAIPYTIRFENSPQAGAPARQVAVTQRLDADLDWRTFRIGDFGWGDVYIHVPENRAFYSERLDLRDTMGIYVDAAAGIDIAGGQAFWTFTAIDPATGEMPTSATAGFLPPNDDTGRGQGLVSYTVRPSAGAATGTVIDALATIVFDTEPPIDTPPIFNTLDAAAPSSAVAPLPAIAAGEEFLVRWSGADAPGGSALESYTVYVSDNGSPFQPWLADTTLTEAPFAGKRGHTYAFYSTSRDNAGNAESAPAAADALTTVPNTAPQVVLGGDATLAEGSLFTRIGEIIDPDPGDAWTATVDYDDGAGAQPLALVGKTFDLSHLYAENGVYHVQVTVTDSCGASGSGTLALTVNNVAPTLTSLSGDTLVTRGGTASFSAAATDPGNDTLIYTWDFGDGSAPSAGPNTSHVFAKAGDYTVSLTVDDGDGGRASGTLAVKVLSEPAVVAVQIGDGAAQRSMIKSITVSFDQAVALEAGAMAVVRSDGLPIAVGVANPSGDGRTYVLTFSGAGTRAGSLDDGRYQLTVVAAKVRNLAGGAMAADSVRNLHRFFGDGDGDGDVDLRDYRALVLSFNRAAGSSRFNACFDYNSDNRVNIPDLAEFRKRYRKTVDQVTHVVPGQVTVAVNDGQAQRSIVDSITVSFDRAVTIGAGAFELVRDDGLVVSVQATLAPDGKSARLTFTGPDIVGGSLADGVYTLKVHRGMIWDLGGNAIGTGDLTMRFHRLFGDIDGDRDMDRLDYATIRGALGSSLGDVNYSRLYDFDGDGDVDALDLAAMKTRLGRTLTV